MGSPREECKHAISKEGLEACNYQPNGTDKERHNAGVCFEPYHKRAKKECKGLPDHPANPRLDCWKKTREDRTARDEEGQRLKKACPDKIATALNLGKDFKEIEQIDAEGHANQLVTLRLKILDLSTPLSKEDISAYHEALRNFFYNAKYGNESIIKAVGLSTMDEFTAMYIYEVADALRDRGDKYFGTADSLEILLEVMEALRNV